MVRLSRNGSALIASGGMNLCMKLREKMETHYQNQLRKEYSPNQTSINYLRDLTQQEKDNLFKEIYSNIDLFNRLVHEAKNIN